MLPNFKWPTPKEKFDDELIRNVIEHKCSVIGIPEDSEGSRYSFSIGLYLHFNHPEIVIFGLNHKVAADTINEICAQIEKGSKFKPNEVTREIFKNIRAKLIEVDPEFYKDFFGTALWFYRSIEGKFPILQVVWPDKFGKFPCDLNCAENSKYLQPILAKKISQ